MKKAFENIFGKGENAGNQHFLLFPKCFLVCQRRIELFEPRSTIMLSIKTCLQFYVLKSK